MIIDQLVLKDTMLSVRFYLGTLERGWVWRAEREEGRRRGYSLWIPQVTMVGHGDTLNTVYGSHW